MSSEKLWKIPFWSIPLFVAHGIEEYLTFPYNRDPNFVIWGSYLHVSAQNTFLVSQAIWWIALIIGVILIKKRVWILSQLAVLALAGIYLFELEHPINAVRMSSYYSGLITSIPLIILGFFYWKSLLRFDARR